MKMYYYNDTKAKAVVYTGDFNSQPVVLEPQRGSFFEVLILSGQDEIPFIKVWSTGVVLLAAVDGNFVDTAG